MKKVLLFDLDQTILDRTTSLIHFLEWQINFFQLTPQISKSDFIKKFIELENNGQVWKDIVYDQLIKDFDINNYSAEELLLSYVSDFNKFCIGFDQAHNTIRCLFEKGHQIGLVSNGKSPFQEHNFYALGLTEYFSTVIVSDAIGLRKPDENIFTYACSQLNCSPTDCIFIGDNPIADIEGAKNVGMKTIFFHPTRTLEQPFADESIHHYDQLEMAINRLQM